MSESDRVKNKGAMWGVTALVVAAALLISFGIIYIGNRNAAPAGPAEPSSSYVPPEPPPSSSEPAPPPESSSPEESSAPSSSVPPSSTAPTPPPKPVRPPAPMRVTVDEPGNYSEPATYRQMVINVGGVHVSNKTITGDLFIMDCVGETDIVLENVIVKGTLYLYGGSANTVTLKDVVAPKALLQKDNGVMGVIATGATTIDEAAVKCHVNLTEKDLTGKGFVKMSIEESPKVWYEISMKGVELDELAVRAAANLSTDSRVVLDKVIAEASLHLSGEGSVDELRVRSDNVSYETAPHDILVSKSYPEPVHGGSPIGSVEPDRSFDRTVTLSAPTGLSIEKDTANDRCIAHWEAVDRCGGYEIIPYIGGVKKAPLQVPSSELSVVLLDKISTHTGSEVEFRVCALGSGSQHTRTSGYKTSSHIVL